MDDNIDLSKAEVEKEEKKASFFSQNKSFFLMLSFLIAFLTFFFLPFLFLRITREELTLSQEKNQDIKSSKNVIQKEIKSEKKIARKEVLGFLPSWTIAQEAKIDTKLLTQLVYFGLGVNPNGEIIRYGEDGLAVLEWHYFTSDYFKEIKDKALRENVKVLIAIKNFDNENIDNLISNTSSTNNFIKEIISILKKYKLDGVNLDFEYLTDSNFPTSKYFNSFLVKLSDSLKKENPGYILSIDVNATAVIRDSAYDMVKIGEAADYIVLMAYDYHTVKSERAGPVAPLQAKESEESIEKSINSLKGRVPAEKIILAVPFYGYEWQTVNEANKSLTVENSGALATYKRVKELMENRDDVKLHFDEVSKTPWLSYFQSGAIKQIYFEDERSLSIKLDFIKSEKLGGVGIWALGYEGNYKELWQVIGKQ